MRKKAALTESRESVERTPVKIITHYGSHTYESTLYRYHTCKTCGRPQAFQFVATWHPSCDTCTALMHKYHESGLTICQHIQQLEARIENLSK